MKWYKMYANSIRDIKFRKLMKNTQGMFSHFWTLWTLMLDEASRNSGIIDVEADDWGIMFDIIADQTSEAELGEMIEELAAVDLISIKDGGSIVVKNWDKYQNQSSYDRVVKHREDKKNAEQITKVIQMFNELTGSRYSDKTKSNREHINARLEEGRTMEEIRAVILDRIKKWGNDPKMKQYIRPSTIFIPANFDKYLNEIPKEVIDATNDGTILKVRDLYGNETSITQEQFDKASDGFYTIIT